MLGRWLHTSPAQQIVAGPGAADTLGDLLRQLGVRRALVVTTRGRLQSDAVSRLVERSTRAVAATTDAVEPGVPAPVVQQLVGLLRSEGIDGLVSVGGGSAVDTAKAVAFFAEHESGAPGSGFADRPVLPHVAVATTLVGAAYTSTFSMTEPTSRRSTSAGGPTMAPSAVVLDAELGADLSAADLATSATVAAAHALEAAWSATSPEARALGLAGLAGLARAVPAAVAEPGDVALRAPVVEAAALCGRARQNTPDGLQQALAQLVGGRGAAVHADAHAALLPVTTRFVADLLTAEQLAGVASALGGGDDDGAGAVAAFVERIGATRHLGELGLTDEDLDAVARQSAAQRGVQTALRPVGEADIRALLDAAW